MSLVEIRRMLDKKRQEFSYIHSRFKEEKEALKEAESHLVHAEGARDLIQNVAQMVQQEAHQQIAAVVTRGLQAVFDEPYTFRIDFEKKRGRTEARLVFERDGLELDPLSAAGGGVIDIAAFTLRVACLMLSRPAVRPILLLDEPFKNVSKANGYLDRIPTMVLQMVEDLGLQIIMVTHIEELKMGTVVEVG